MNTYTIEELKQMRHADFEDVLPSLNRATLIDLKAECDTAVFEIRNALKAYEEGNIELDGSTRKMEDKATWLVRKSRLIDSRLRATQVRRDCSLMVFEDLANGVPYYVTCSCSVQDYLLPHLMAAMSPDEAPVLRYAVPISREEMDKLPDWIAREG